MRDYVDNLTFYQPVPKGIQRFRELIVYISEKCADCEFFGATKLNKILYHSDFRAFERFGEPLTGVAYFALNSGPAPVPLVPIRRELIQEGAITIEERPVGARVQHRVVAIREAYTELFTPVELELVGEVIEELWDQSAEEASNASHDVRWRTLRLEDRIPYEATFLSDDELSEEDLTRTKELADEFGWK
jgi:hypothetical protein